MRNLILMLGFLLSLYPSLQAQDTFITEGKASVYADKFQGSLTKSEEPYDMNQFTAAHRTLSIGTYMEVTNKDNGKAVVVRINDYGPYQKDRIIEVSRVAAEYLGMLEARVAEVSLRVVDPPAKVAAQPTTTTTTTTTVPAQPEMTAKSTDALLVTRNVPDALENKVVHKGQVKTLDGMFTIQLGAFSTAANAKARMKELSKLGFTGSMMVLEMKEKGKTRYKLILENFKDRVQAAKRVKELKEWYKLDCFILTLK